MRRIFVGIMIMFLLAIPVHAVDLSAPEAPDAALSYMPDETESFGEGLLFVIREAVREIQPGFTEAADTCAITLVVTVTIGILSMLTDKYGGVFDLAGVLIAAILLLQPAKSLIHLSTQTIEQISQYGKMLLPVMSAAMAAQGGTTKSTAIYTGTAFFDMLLSSAISELLIPLVYIYICIAVVSRGFSVQILQDFRDFLKWLLTWCLKTVLYVFTGYLGITGIVSGSTDAAMLKATKLTISGMVPVVGGILSDASDAVLVSAGLVKNSAGVYGLLAVTALWIGPFLEIGIQYLYLKLTSGICRIFGTKAVAGVVNDFSETMGLLLAMTGAMCLIVLISTVCFMKGVG